MLKFIYFYFALVFTIFTLNQDLFATKEYNNWYFGDKLGISFNTPYKEPIELTDGAHRAFEGNFTQSDTNGNLLFYIDGNTIYNKNHQKMPLNFGFFTSSGESSTQGVMAFRKQDNDSIYYIITVGTEASERKMRLHNLDLRLDNGLGGLLPDSKILLDKPTEKLAAIKHYNGKDIWIVTAEKLSDISVQYVSFLLTNDGIDLNSKVISTEFCKNDIGTCQLKISPNGKYIATASRYTMTEVAEFNNSTGQISNNIALNIDEKGFQRKWRSYSLDFSPDSKKLYVSDSDSLRFNCFEMSNFNESSILSSHYFLELKKYFKVKYPGGGTWGMQLAPNGKIYVIAQDSSHNLFSIDNPNEDLSNIKMSKFFFKNKKSEILYLGLPNIPTFYFENKTANNECAYECDIKLGDTIVRAGKNACINFEIKVTCPLTNNTPEIITDFKIKLVYNPMVFEIDKSLYNVISENLVNPNRLEIELLFKDVKFTNDTIHFFQFCGNTLLSEHIKTNITIDSIYFNNTILQEVKKNIKNGSVGLIYCNYNCDIILGDTIVRAGEDACINFDIKVSCPEWTTPEIVTDFRVKLVYNPLVFLIDKSQYNVISENLVTPNRMEMELLFEDITFVNDISQVFRLCGKTLLSDVSKTDVVLESIILDKSFLSKVNTTIKNGSVAIIYCNYVCDIKLADTTVVAGENACINFNLNVNCPDWTTPYILTDFKVKLAYNPLVFTIDKTLYNVLSENIVSPNLVEIELLFEDINFVNDVSHILQICGKTYLSEFSNTDVVLDSIYFYSRALDNITKTIKNGSITLTYCDFTSEIKLSDTTVSTGSEACIDLEVKIKCPMMMSQLTTDVKIKLIYNPTVFSIDRTLYTIISENLIAPNRMEIELLFKDATFSNDTNQVFVICGRTFLSEFIKTEVELDSIYFNNTALQKVNKSIKNGSVELTHCLGTMRLLTFLKPLEVDLHFDQSNKTLNFDIINKNQNNDYKYDLEYCIFDILGNVINQDNLKVNQSLQTYHTLNLNQLGSGVYFVNIKSGLLNKTEKFYISN